MVQCIGRKVLIKAKGRQFLSGSEHSTFKICRDCGEEKPVGDFYPHKRAKDGLRSYCKPCNAARAIAWDAANKEKKAARMAEQYNADKEKEAARNAEWREENPNYMREWNQDNPNYMREWRKDNREQKLLRQREWREANPEKAAAMNRNRRARKREAPGSHTADDIQAQRERQNGRCYWCNCEVGDEYHVDHVTPLSKGGSNWPSNLVIACESCNLSKGAKLPQDFAGVMF